MPTTSPALLDLGTARRLVQGHVGKAMEVTVCWQPPEGIYRACFDENESGADDNFYFAVLEAFPKRIGATRHIAMNRRTDKITELGMLGE